jgi:hypothetical protein
VKEMRYILLFFCTIPLYSSAQIETEIGTIYQCVVIDGDTVPVVNLDLVSISSPREFKNERQRRRWNVLIKRVNKVYPYAKAAGDLMHEYEDELAKLETKKDRKEYLKLAEADLKAQFEGDITDMTISEGIILIKLIDRETGDCSYELISELRGSFSAFMWQSLARLFGHNLKSEYDGEGDDAAIEEIVSEIEMGIIHGPAVQIAKQ